MTATSLNTPNLRIASDCFDEERITPLHIASAEGNDTIVDALLSTLSIDDINKETNLGWTAVMYAARKGHTTLFQKLVKLGADITSKNRIGTNILVMAVASGNIDMVKMTVNELTSNTMSSIRDDVVSPLLVASLHGYSDIVQFLICNGFSVNTNYTGITPLMLASMRGYRRVVEILLQNGADATYQNSVQQTAVDIATAYNHSTLIPLLEIKKKNNCSTCNLQQTSNDVNTRQYGWSSPIAPKLVTKRSVENRNIANTSPRNFGLPSPRSEMNYCNSDIKLISNFMSPIDISSVRVSNSNEQAVCSASENCVHVPVPPVSPYNVCSNSYPFTLFERYKVSMNNGIYCADNYEESTKLLLNKSFPSPPYFTVGHDNIDIKVKRTQYKSTKWNALKQRLCSPFLVIKNLKFFRRRKCSKFPESPFHVNIIPDISSNRENTKKVQCETLPYPTDMYLHSFPSLSSPIPAPKLLIDLLRSLNLSAYISMFMEHEIDIDSFFTLNEDDLKEIGISDPVGQFKLLEAIRMNKETYYQKNFNFNTTDKLL